MPVRVPLSPQVQEQNLPGVRLDANAPSGAFGGGRPLAHNVAQANQNIDIIKEEQHKIDFYDALSGLTQLKQWENESGYESVLGENARELPKRMQEEYRKRTEDIASTLKNDRQRAIFQQKAEQNGVGFMGGVINHTRRQKSISEAQKTDAFVATFQDAGIKAGASGNLADMEKSAGEIDRARRVWGAQNGVPDNAVELMIRDDASKVYSGAITGMVNARNYDGAKDALAKYGDGLPQKERDRLTALVKQESDLGKAYELADVALSYEPETLQAALNHIDKIVEGDKIDPEVRKQAHQLASNRWGALQLARRDESDKLFGSTAERLRQTGDLEAIQRSDVWSRLDEGDKERLESMASRISKTGSPYAIRNNPERLAEFYGKSQEELQRMTKEEILRYKGDMTEGEFLSANKHWSSARTKEENATFKFNQADEHRIFNAMKLAKIGDIRESDTVGKLRGDKALAWDEFRKEAMDALEARFQKDKKNADPKERDQVINDLIIDKAIRKDASNVLSRFGLWGMGTGIGIVGGASLYGIGKAIDKWRAPSITDQERERIKSVVMRIKGSEPSDEKILMLKRAQEMGASPEMLQRLAGE